MKQGSRKNRRLSQDEIYKSLDDLGSYRGGQA